MSAEQLLAELYKGDHPMMVQLRSQLREISRIPGLVTVLIEGPPGTGKTTMARALALARMLSMVDPQYHRFSVERAAREVRSGAALKWYRDISLAGLTDTLADVQLFGIGKDVATDVKARIGIFEQAMTGCLDPKTAKTHQSLTSEAKRNDLIPLATGGVVLLDEIGDLAQNLQAKLLRVLNGEMQFRVGAEGHTDFGFTFRGLIALATWRDIDGQCELREDLRQRILQHRIRVPGLSDYPSEVRWQIVLSAAEAVKREIRDELTTVDGLVARSVHDDTAQVLAAEWLDYANRSADKSLPNTLVAKLVDIDWSKYGQLRGLRATLRRALSGGNIDESLAETQIAFSVAQRQNSAETSIDRLKRYLREASSFPDCWMNDRHDWATEILERLDQEEPGVLRVVDDAAQSVSQVKKQLRNLKRSGSAMSGN